MISGYYSYSISKELLINPATTKIDNQKPVDIGANQPPDRISDKTNLALSTLSSFCLSLGQQNF